MRFGEAEAAEGEAVAQASLAAGNVDQARGYVGDLEKYHPKYIFGKLLKAQTSFAAGETQKALQEIDGLIAKIRVTFPTAEISQQQLVQLQVRAISARGQAHLALGKVNEARADLQEVLRLSPSSANANVNLARLEIAAKNYAPAMTLFEKALALDKTNFDALSGIVTVFKQQKQFAEANQRIDAAASESGDKKDVKASLHYLKADVFAAENNTAAAEAELLKAIETDGDYLPAYSAYAALLISQKQSDRAIEQYKKVIEKKPSAAVYSLIGMLEDARENVAEAEKNYREALKLTPETPIAANNLAWLIAAYDRGNLDEALKLAQMSVSKNPGVAGFYDTLGFVYFKKGLHPTAAEQFKKAITLDEAEAAKGGLTRNPGYRLRLAMALAALGDRPNAKREAETAAKNENNLSPQEQVEVKKLLSSL